MKYQFQVRHKLLDIPVYCATARDVVLILHALQSIDDDPDSIGEAIPCPAEAEPAPASTTDATGAG